MQQRDVAVSIDPETDLNSALVRFLYRECGGVPVALIVCAVVATALGVLVAWSAANG